MKAKPSKAQQEVREWKENLSGELLKRPQKERVPYILDKTKKTVEKLKKHKKDIA